MKSSKENLHYISLLRVSSMLLIVLFHSMCFYIGEWWYLGTNVVPLLKTIAFPIEQIGLTTFVFISGFLYGYMYIERGKYRDVLPFLNKKILRLLIPYFFWGVLMIITMPAVHISWINLLTGISHLWFLLMLFELFVISSLFNKFGIGKNSTIYIDLLVTIISFILVYVWNHYSSHHYALGIGNTLHYLPAFLIGYFYAKYRIDKTNSIFLFSTILVLGIILTFLVSINGYTEGSTLYRIPSILVSVSALVILKDFFKSCNQSKVIDSLDNNSMGIYIFNQIVVFLILLNSKAKIFLSHHSYLGVVIIFVISLLVPWIFSDMLRRIKFVSFLIG